MKKMLVGLLCLMLAAGTVSGCGNKKSESEESSENKVEESKDKDKEETESEKEEKEQDKETEQETDKETDKKNDKEDIAPEEKTEDENENKTDEEIIAEDLTMKILREQAGTRDYTSLEELNPEPGSHIAVVVKSTKTGFWGNVKKGMDAAVKDLNEKLGYKGEDKIRLSFEGPADETDVESQINIIDAVLSENPSVLCLAAIDMESCTAQLETAAENDIPVVVLDSKVESDLINTVCATDNYAAGAEAARKLAEAIENKGRIAVMAHVETSETSQSREKGFTDEIAKSYPEIEIVNISYENQETSMAELAKAVLTLYPDVKGYYCTNEVSANEVLPVIEASKKPIFVVGFDAGKKQIEAVKKGVQLGMLAQNPYGMGYATVVAGIRADLGLENDLFINTGYQWIDSTSLELPEYGNYLYE